MTLGQVPRKHKTPPEEVWKLSPRSQRGGRHWRETSTGTGTKKCGRALRYHRLQKKAPIMHQATSLDEPNTFCAHFDLLSEDQPLSVSPTDVRAKSVELKWHNPKPKFLLTSTDCTVSILTRNVINEGMQLVKTTLSITGAHPASISSSTGEVRCDLNFCKLPLSPHSLRAKRWRGTRGLMMDIRADCLVCWLCSAGVSLM